MHSILHRNWMHFHFIEIQFKVMIINKTCTAVPNVVYYRKPQINCSQKFIIH